MKAVLRKSIKISIILLGLFIPLSSAYSQSSGNSLGLKVSSSYNNNLGLFARKRQPVFAVDGYVPGDMSYYFDHIKWEIELESTEEPVTIRQTLFDDVVLRSPISLPFHEFVLLVQNQVSVNYWQEYTLENFIENELGQRDGGGINLEIPVKIKNKTFQKIFGSGTVGLVVTGDIRIQAGIRREDRSEVRTALTQGANTNFKMQQTQRFSVTGKIGDKVKVNVDQDSERAFDFDNNVRLVYEGYDDEIVKKFEAGNIALSLPGTQYVTFSGKNSGLFGLKTEMELGNLNLIAIASQEKGESQKLSLTGGSSAGKKKILDYNYLKDTYFFLDMFYREQYRQFTEQGDHVANRDSSVIPDSLILYKAAAANEQKFPDKVIQGRATVSGRFADTDTFAVFPGSAAGGAFVTMERTEYTLQEDEGWIRLNSPLAEGEILAVAYKTAGGVQYGDINFVRDITSTQIINLKLIRDQNPLPTHEVWDLSWKHVYSLGSRNIDQDGFEVQMFFSGPSSLGEEIDPETGLPWLQVFGLDTKDQNGSPTPDGKIDIDLNTLSLPQGELHFRDLQPFDPIGYFLGAALVETDLTDDSVVPAIYKETDQSIIRRNSNFYLEVATQSRGTEYNLGFNVIEESEVVILNGQTMQRGRDYTIDYFAGQLVMLNAAASSPSAQLDITYERNQLFQLEKKTILGMRAEYDLGQNSFIGGTLLYLNESTLDNKVRVGRGPMRNVVWDFNTRLKFKPNFIGKAFDFMPMIRAKGETDMTFEGEIAQVLPTPNTLNSPKTGDDKGVAYIDDFEAAKKTINLGVIRRNWSLASQPADGLHNYANKLNNFIWYNPFRQVAIQDIFPDRELNANVPQLQHVLTMEFFDPEEPEADTTRWAGVMRALSPGFFDQSQTKFVEVMVQGDVGRVHLEFGTISEDIIPNTVLDTEDKKQGGIRNGVLDPGEDLGLDLETRADPPTMNFPRKIVGQDSSLAAVEFDFWDVNRDGFKNFDEPWSYDNWFYNSTEQFIFANGDGAIPGISSVVGTEGNQNDEGGRVPDTEDINGNSILDAANQYFSFSFSLSDSSPDTSLIVGGNPDNPASRGGPWKLYRIPFSVGDADFLVGSPTTSQIQNVRIWVDSLEYTINRYSIFPNIARVSIADINLVGSEWKEKGTTQNEYNFDIGLTPPDQLGDVFAVTQINNHENPAYGEAIVEIKVSGEEDKVTGIRAREQSLVLKTNNLLGNDAGVAQKSLFQNESYIHYDRIKMFVYGIDNTGMHFPVAGDSSYLEYFMRFGANDNNYYEYRSTVHQGWDLAQGRNGMDVELLTFTTIDRSDTTQVDSVEVGGTYYDKANDVYVKRISNTARVVVKGNPSFTNVRVLTMGLKNIHPDGVPFTGEVWFNELRLADVDQDKGMAMRAKASMRIGDFANINVNIEKKDADFRNVATQFGTGNNSLSRSFNASVNVDKMLPQFLGIAVPVSLTYRENSSHPKYFPGRDRKVTNADLNDSETLSLIETTSEQTGFNASFRRSAKSKNFLVKNTVDNLSLNIGRSETKSTNPTLAESKNTSWTGSIDYKLTFGRNNYVSFLSWLPDLPLIRRAKDTKLYYTPQNITLRMNGTKVNTLRQNRIQNSNQLADATVTENFTVDRSARASMKIFESLSVDINRSYKSQMNGATFNDFLNFKFNDINQSQSFKTTYSPKVFDWLRNDFTYSSNFQYANSLQNQETGRSARNSANKSANFTLQWKQLSSSLFGGGGNKRKTSRRNAPPPKRSGDIQDKNQLSIFQQKEAGGVSFNPLKIVGSFFSAFKDLQVNYSEQDNHNQAGIAELKAKPTWRYQFGLSDTTGLASVANLSGTPITRNHTETVSINSGFAFGRLLDIGLRFQDNSTLNDSKQISGTSSKSWLSESDFDMPFPEWTVRLSGLNKLPLFNKVFKTVTFSHGFSGQKTESWSGNESNITNASISSNFRPLGKLDLSFKNGFTGNIQFNRSRTLTQTFSFSNGQTIPLGANRNTNNDFTLTANYSKRSGFTLPFWPFNKGGLKNSVDLSLSFTASTVTAENTQSGDFVVSNETKRWSFQPRMTYSFSTTVRGGAFIEIGKTDSKKIGSTSIQEFGIDVNIAIRGN